MNEASWENFYEATDPEICWDIMENTIRESLDVMCPLKQFKVNEIREAWVTDELLEEINDKDFLLKLAKSSGKEDDWKAAKRERNRVGKIVGMRKLTL